MGRRPRGLLGVAHLVTQQQCQKPLARLALHRHGILARPYQITHRLVPLIGHVDRRQLSSARQTRESHRIAPVRLQALAGPTWRHRRRHHHASQTLSGQATLQPEAAGTGLIHKHQLAMRTAELSHNAIHRLRITADLTITTHFVFIGDRDLDRILVHVHAYKHGARLTHGLPPIRWLMPSCSTCGSAWLAT
jgi:hypothetical protein